MRGLRAFISHPIVALIGAILLATLTTSGIVNMTASWVLLAVAWAIGVYGVHTAEVRQNLPPQIRPWITVIVALVIAILLGLVGAWELSKAPRAERPLSEKEIAREVVNEMPRSTVATPSPLPVPNPPEPTPPLRVDKIEMGRDEARPHGYIVDVFMENLSDREIDSPYRAEYLGVGTGNMSDISLKEHHDQLMKMALAHSPVNDPNRTKVEGNDRYFFTMDRMLSDDEWATYNKDGNRITLMVIQTYKDQILPQGQYWINEYCASTAPHEAVEKCGKYNRSWIHK